MVNYVKIGNNNVNAGGSLKSASSNWVAPNTGATNASGFTALPGGYATFSTYPYGHTPAGLGTNAVWWTSTNTPVNGYTPGLRYIELVNNSDTQNDGIVRDETMLSVRCIKQ
jgi:uncharacterized protein (TIGR02145 family)